MTKYFTADEIWSGGLYELAIEFYPLSNERLFSALQALWEHPALEGCYNPTKEPDEQVPVYPSEHVIASDDFLYGLITLPNKKRVACETRLIREEQGSGWLDLGIPMGALATAYDVKAFPFDTDSVSHKSWRQELDEFLRDIGMSIFNSSPFDLALIDHHCSGEAYAADIRQKGIPVPSHMGYLWPENGNLVYYPRTSNY